MIVYIRVDCAVEAPDMHHVLCLYIIDIPTTVTMLVLAFDFRSVTEHGTADG